MRWLRSVLGYNKRMEDKQKIDSILKTLNKGAIKGDWEPARGFHTYIATEVTPQYNGPSFNFDLGRGMVIKNFVNTKTGEVKSYFFDKVILK